MADIANRDEAEKCLDIAKLCMRRGDSVKAIKFFDKSIRLYELPGARELKLRAEQDLAKAERGDAEDEPAAPRPRRTSSTASASSRPSAAPAGTNSDGKSFTPEQAAAVKRIIELKKDKRQGLYKVLGVPSNADDNEIKKAYRKLALKVNEPCEPRL